ncbi:Bro-N domain-containing protein [Flavonifractor plautii]|nr:Bro-N domain-containing protein [Flavonifractor plautii]
MRTLNLNGEPWFVAADVCKALELGNPSMTVERLDDDEKGISTIDTLGHGTAIIPRGGKGKRWHGSASRS